MKWNARRLNKGWLGIVGPLAVIIIFVELVAVLIYSYYLSHPGVEIPEGNRHAFARVAILMDGTQSVNPENFPLIKRIVREKIIPSLGLNDVAVAYDVQRNFTVAQNSVFGLQGDQLPQDPEDRRSQMLDILERNRESKVPGGDLYDLIRPLAPLRARVESVRSAWTQSVEKREAPTRRGSDICSPLRDLGWFLRSGDPETEKWLVVLSDLQNTGPVQSCHPEDPFPNVKILLIYPFGSNSPAWGRVESFWRSFFSDQKLERVSFAAALADGALIPPNPTAGLERYEIKTQWECARPMILPALALILGLLTVISLLTAFLPRKSEPMQEQGEASAGSSPGNE